MVPAEKEDLVHEGWDFYEQDLNKIKKKIANVFYATYGNDLKTVKIDSDYAKGKSVEIQETLKQCKNPKCEEPIKPISEFTYDKINNRHFSLCKKCRAKKYTDLNRKKRELGDNDKVIEVIVPFERQVAQERKRIIVDAIENSWGRIDLAAKRLKIDRRSIYYILGDAKVKPPDHHIQPLEATLQRFKKQVVQEAVKRANGNKTKAARLIRVDRKTIYDYLKAINP